MTSKEHTRLSLIETVKRLGHPEEFGILIAAELGTEKQMARMISYLVRLRPQSAEEIADEMLSIKEEFDRYRDKKIVEYYNEKNNELMRNGLLKGGEE